MVSVFFVRIHVLSSCICVRIQTEECDRVYQCCKDSVPGGISGRRDSSRIVNKSRMDTCDLACCGESLCFISVRIL